MVGLWLEFPPAFSQAVRSSSAGSLSTNGSQQFDDDDRQCRAYLYLSNGQSVITDSEGLYNFPSLGDGPR
jgi:hypothetical protein